MTRDTIIVCGSRDWNDVETIDEWLTLMCKPGRINRLVHGGCEGADRIAAAWAAKAGLLGIEYPADWNAFGPSAGPRRNAEMVKSEAERTWRGVAFSYLSLKAITGIGLTTGTEDCTARMIGRHIPVLIVTPGARP